MSLYDRDSWQDQQHKGYWESAAEHGAFIHILVLLINDLVALCHDEDRAYGPED